MANGRHTPGPWQYGGQTGRQRGYIRAGLKTTGEPLGIKRIAVVAQDAAMAGGDPEANGRLLAAAPDLLTACQQALALLRHAGGEGPGPLVAILDAAIARAI